MPQRGRADRCARPSAESGWASVSGKGNRSGRVMHHSTDPSIRARMPAANSAAAAASITPAAPPATSCRAPRDNPPPGKTSAALGRFQGQVANFAGHRAGEPCYRCFVGDAFDAEDCRRRGRCQTGDIHAGCDQPIRCWRLGRAVQQWLGVGPNPSFWASLAQQLAMLPFCSTRGHRVNRLESGPFCRRTAR